MEPQHEVEIRDKVFRLEDEMKKLVQIDIPVTHYFSCKGTKNGVYAREITIPKGTILTGHIHKYEQLNIVTKGDISVLTDEGIKRVGAGFVIVSPPGTKRAAYAHEETKWITVHGTDETDVERIEQIFISKDETEYLSFCKELTCLG